MCQGGGQGQEAEAGTCAVSLGEMGAKPPSGAVAGLCELHPPLSPRATRLLGSWSSWPLQPAAPSGQEVAFRVCSVMSEKNDGETRN